MSNSKLTKSFNFTLGCIVPFSGVTPTEKKEKASEKIKTSEKHTNGRWRRGMEIEKERVGGGEGETNNNNNHGSPWNNADLSLTVTSPLKGAN